MPAHGHRHPLSGTDLRRAGSAGQCAGKRSWPGCPVAGCGARVCRSDPGLCTVDLRLLADPLPAGIHRRHRLWSEGIGGHRSGACDPAGFQQSGLNYILVGRPRTCSRWFRQLRAGADKLQQQLRPAGSAGVFVLFDELEPDDQIFIDRMRLSPLRAPAGAAVQVPAGLGDQPGSGDEVEVRRARDQEPPC
jgi:hypothetical protein